MDSRLIFLLGILLAIDGYNSLSVNHQPDNSSFRTRRNPLQYGWPRYANSLKAEKFLQSIYDSDAPVPDALDWRKVPGRVSEVKRIGDCKAYWVFQATGLLEGQEVNYANLTDGKLIPLSEQNLLDCDRLNFGCELGLVEHSLDDIVLLGGINDEKTYPFEDKVEKGKCRFDKSKSVMSITGYAVLPKGDEEKLKEVVAKYGPVAVMVDSWYFREYTHGVYYNKGCTSFYDNLNDGMLIVGYGTDPTQGDYWILKNSMGKEWGEDGYMRLARNRKNHCGVATAAAIATFN